MTTFRYEKQILEYHLDTFGHVNNAVYLQLYEEARWDLITRNGYGLERVLTEKIGPTVLEVNVKFKKELKLRQHIVIETEFMQFEGKIGRIKQRILNEKNELCSEAEWVIGLFDLRQRKLIDPTPGWYQAVGLTPPI